VKRYKTRVVKPPAIDDQTSESIKAEYACKLEWLNLHAPNKNLVKIEQSSSVDSYTYIFEQLFPGLIDYMKENCLSRVTCNEKWHILLTALDFLEIRLPQGIQWQKLVKGQLKDNFMFLKWFQRFHALNKGINDEVNESGNEDVIVEYMDDDEVCGDTGVDVVATKAEMKQAADAINQKRDEAKNEIEKLKDIKEKLQLSKEKTSGFRLIKQNNLRNEIQKVEEQLREKKEATERIRGTFLSHTLETAEDFRLMKGRVKEELDEILELEKDVKKIPAFNWCYKQYVLNKIKQMRQEIAQKAKALKWLESRQDMVDMGKVLEGGSAGKKNSYIQKVVCDYCDPKLARALGPQFSLQ